MKVFPGGPDLPGGEDRLFLSALAHLHGGFRNPAAGWLGAGVLMPSLITSYNWFVSLGEKSQQSLDSPWCRF